MGPTYLVISARPLTRDQVVAFILQQGGILETLGPHDGLVNGIGACVDIMLDNDSQTHGLAPLQPADSTPEAIQEWKDELVLREEIRAKLGGEPKAVILLDLIRGIRSQWIAWRLIQLMFKQWSPCVLRTFGPPADVETRRIWTPDEIADFWTAHHHLPDS